MPTWLHYVRTFEPARLRAAYTAVVALALALGISIPADVDGKITALIGALVVVLPLLQGELTRAAVVPVAVVGQIAAAAVVAAPPAPVVVIEPVAPVVPPAA